MGCSAEKLVIFLKNSAKCLQGNQGCLEREKDESGESYGHDGKIKPLNKEGLLKSVPYLVFFILFYFFFA